MPIDDLENLIHTLSEHHVLNPNLLKAIISQESQWNIYVTRYENNYRWLFDPEKFAGPLNSLSTEINLQKTSWGLAQIMGALARELGHTGFMAELIKPEVNLEYLCIHLVHLFKISNDIHDVLAMYNGGEGALHKSSGKYSNQSYVDSCLVYLQKFQSSSMI